MPNSNIANLNTNTNNQIENLNLDIITMISQLETPINTQNFIKTFDNSDLNTDINKKNYINALENIKPLYRK